MKLKFFTQSPIWLQSILVFLSTYVNLVPVLGQNSSSSSTLTFHQKEILDERNSLSLEWNVSLESKTILVTIETLRADSGSSNYVAIGLTKKGRIENATDVIVTGIDGDGRPYVVDMVTISNRTAVQDRNQDWQLIDGRRFDSGGSRITIQRRFETCDEQDIPFNTNLIHVVWDEGQSQSIPAQLDFTVRNASRPIYFLDPIVVPQLPQNGESLQTFRVSRRLLVPARHTSYWCSIHKLNATLNTKHHIVGFAPYFENELGRKHVHHQIVQRCIAPPGSDPAVLFEPFVNHPGEECIINSNTQIPHAYCGEYLYETAVGGKNVPFSDSVGFALGGESSPVEYFMYQTHYDNPEVRDDLELETGVDFLYSSKLRPNEGGILLSGHTVLGQWTMPPLTTEFDLAGHCNPSCTSTMFPPEGVDVLAIRLHAHLNSRRIKIKHFRGNKELAWIQNDDNYDFNFQQWRWLYNPVKLLPGDQITVQCGFDNIWKNDSSATVSGYSTRDEMCVGWLLISKRLPHNFCMSEYPTENTMARFGIQNMTWEVDSYDRIIHAATNPQNVGLTFTQLTTNAMRNWTPEQKEALENDQLYSQHNAGCPNFISGGRILHYFSLIQQELPEGVEMPLPEAFRDVKISDRTISTPGLSSTARYPREVPEYVPESSCPASGGLVNGRRSNGSSFGDRNTRPLRFPYKRKSSVWGGQDPIRIHDRPQGKWEGRGDSGRWRRN